jgi:hypothetical protein
MPKFKVGQTVKVLPHKRYYSITPGNSELVNPPATNHKGGETGVVNRIFDNDGTFSVEVDVKPGSQYGDYREYEEDELVAA